MSLIAEYRKGQNTTIRENAFSAQRVSVRRPATNRDKFLKKIWAPLAVLKTQHLSII